MDTLIELIVRALIALFTGSSERRPVPLPPSRPVPKIPPIRQVPQPRQPQMRRPPTGQLPGRFPPARRPNVPPPTPQPTPAAPPPPRIAAPPAPAAVSSAPPAISAAAIRQLMLSRKSALRTIYVLSEVVGPPLALRRP